MPSLINPQLFHPLNMAFIGLTLIGGLYFYKWMKKQVEIP